MRNKRQTWAVSVRCTTRETKILVTEGGHDLLKARLSPWPNHPRSLLSLCEGLGLWHGARLSVAVYADEDAAASCERIFYGSGLYEQGSALVELERRLPAARGRRIRGLGDFRQLRLLEGES